MSLETEMELLEEDLAEGHITLTEYNLQYKEILSELGDDYE